MKTLRFDHVVHLRRLWMLATWVVLLASFLTPSAPGQQTAGKLDPSFGASLGLLGNVYVIQAQADGKVLVGGSFPKGLARLNTDGSLDTTFDVGSGIDNSRTITSIVLQANGKVLIGGSFSNYNGSPRPCIAALNADGSLDQSFISPYGVSINGEAIVIQPDGRVLVSCADGIARLNANGSLDASFNCVTDTLVTSLALQPDGKIVFGGYFTRVQGVVRNRGARINSDGGLDVSFDPGSGLDGAVESLSFQTDGKTIVGGYFTHFNGVAHGNIARLNADGSPDQTFNGSGVKHTVYTSLIHSIALQSNGKIIIGGLFNQIDGARRDNAARLNEDGTLDVNYDPQVREPRYSLAQIQSVVVQTDGKLLIGGQFSEVAGKTCNSVARLNIDDSLDESFRVDVAPGPNSSVSTTVFDATGRVLISGPFTQFSGETRSGIARMNSDGSLDTGFNPTVTDELYLEILRVLPQPIDGKTLIGGAFTRINGVPTRKVARLNPNGSLDQSFAPNAGVIGKVSMLVRQPDSKILVNGFFGNFNGQPRDNSLARLNDDGTLDTSFDVGSGVKVYYVYSAVLQPDGRLLIGGSALIGGQSHPLFRLNSNGSLDTTFNPDTSVVSTSSIALQPDNKIIVGGSYSQGIIRLNVDGSLDSNFHPPTNGFQHISSTVLQPDGKIVASGILADSRNTVVRFNQNGNLDASFDVGVGPNNLIKTVALKSDGKVIVGGDFTKFDGIVRNYAARINADGTLDQNFNPGVGAPSVLALARQPEDGDVVIGGSFTSAGGQAANALARLLPNGRLDVSFTAPFNPGDSVQALQRQPNNAVVASALVIDNSSGGGAGLRAARSKSRLPEASPAEGSRHPIQPHAETKVKNPIVRCSPIDGSFDPTFNPNAGTSGVGYCLSLQPTDGKIIVGGSFAKLNDTAGHPNLGRLDANGFLDASFNASANATVQTVLAQPDGRIALGGIFTQVNGAPRGRLARLLADGSLDPGFNPFAGTDGPVAALKLQRDGRLLVAGTFANANGAPRANLARFNADGSLDVGFSPAVALTGGGTALVSSVDQQADGKLVIAGLFDRVNDVVRNKVARLLPDGTTDPDFDPGAGPDAVVRAIALQPDGKTLLGGDFTTVDNIERKAAARLLGDFDLNAYPALGQWRIINFSNPNNAGNAADTAAPFGDGVVNLLKFALNLNAQAADATPMTPTGAKGLPLVARDAQGRLTLTFVRRQSGTAPGITYSVEFADGLTGGLTRGFAPNPAATISQPVPIDAVWERVTVTDSVAMSPQTPRRFARLRVTTGN